MIEPKWEHKCSKSERFVSVALGDGIVGVLGNDPVSRRSIGCIFAKPNEVLDLISSLQAAFDRTWPEYAADQARARPNA